MGTAFPDESAPPVSSQTPHTQGTPSCQHELGWWELTSSAPPFFFFLFSKVKVKSLSRVRLSATPWTVAYQAPPSMGFPRQEYWSGLPFPSPGDLPDPRIEPGFPSLEADALTSEPPRKPHQLYSVNYIGIQLILPLVFQEWENKKAP